MLAVASLMPMMPGTCGEAQHGVVLQVGDRARRARCTGSSAGRPSRRSCGSGGTGLPASACCSRARPTGEAVAPAFFADSVSSIASAVELPPVPAMIGMRPLECSHRDADQLLVLVEVDGRRFAGGADHHDAVGAFGDVPVDQLSEAREVERAVLVHRRDDCDQAAGNHGAILIRFGCAPQRRKAVESWPVSAAPPCPARSPPTASAANASQQLARAAAGTAGWTAGRIFRSRS